MLTYNYLLSHYISYFKLFILTLNYIFSLNIVEAIDYKISINFRSADSISFENMIRQLYFKALFFFARFEKILRFSRNEKNPRVIYIVGGQITPHSRITLSFLYNSRRITCNCFGLNQVTRINPLPYSLARCQRPSKLFTMNK